jgi:hypothetical protein
MNDQIQPDILGAIEREMSFIETSSRTKTNRVKIPKGHLWRVRFLPVEQGKSRVWWGRYIFHWLNKRPYLCPRTPEEFGGRGENAPCPLCDMAEKLNASADQNISRIGYKAMAMPQWLLYCLVVSKDDGEREIIAKEPDLWKPWEFWMSRSSMADITQLYKQYLKRDRSDGPDYSFLDLMEGTTVAVKSRKQGLRFTPERPSPIVDAERYDQVVQYIWSQIKFPNFKAAPERELSILARKLEEYAEDGGVDDSFGGASEQYSSRDRDDDDDDADYDDDRTRRPFTQAVRQRADDASEDDEEMYREQKRRAVEAETRPVPPPPRAAAPARPTPPVPPPAAPAKPAAPALKTVPPPPARLAKPVPPPPARPYAPAHVTSSVSDEEDNVAEEARDPAPPMDPDDGDLPPVDAEGAQPEAAEVAPAPAPAPPPPPPPASSLSERLRRGITSASKR